MLLKNNLKICLLKNDLQFKSISVVSVMDFEKLIIAKVFFFFFYFHL